MKLQKIDKEKREENITKEKQKENKTIIILICVCVVSILFNAFFAQLAQVSGDSMHPTLESGQLLLVLKWNKSTDAYERGDILVFSQGGKHLIKRLIALPGETVQIKDNQIYINDEVIDDYVDVEMEDAGLLSEKITLKENEFIFLGDNRNHSSDSRSFGVVKIDQIVGKVIFRFTPPTKY